MSLKESLFIPHIFVHHVGSTDRRGTERRKSSQHQHELREPTWVWTKLFQSCPTLCNPMDYSQPGSSVHGILQARILEWDVMLPVQGREPKDYIQHLTKLFCAWNFPWRVPQTQPTKNSAQLKEACVCSYRKQAIETLCENAWSRGGVLGRQGPPHPMLVTHRCGRLTVSLIYSLLS